MASAAGVLNMALLICIYCGTKWSVEEVIGNRQAFNTLGPIVMNCPKCNETEELLDQETALIILSIGAAMIHDDIYRYAEALREAGIT